MAKVVGIVCQKGGVGKTTTAAALACGLVRRGFRVLSVDLDGQANLTTCMGGDTSGLTSFDVLLGTPTAKEAIKPAPAGGDIIAGHKALASVDVNLTHPGREYRLKEKLEPVLPDYDFIILDTGPSLGTLTTNAIVAANTIVVPLQADLFSLEGVVQMMETVMPIKQYYNTALTISGFLLTRFSNRAILSRAMVQSAEGLASKVGSKVFDARIREAVCIKEAQTKRQSLFDYAPKERATADYEAFVTEFLAGQGGK